MGLFQFWGYFNFGVILWFIGGDDGHNPSGAVATPKESMSIIPAFLLSVVYDNHSEGLSGICLVRINDQNEHSLIKKHHT